MSLGIFVFLQECCRTHRPYFPSRRPTATAWRLSACAPPTRAARPCTGAWSSAQRMQLCPRWGSKWLPSAWRGRTLCWADIPLCRRASASAAYERKSSVYTFTGAFAWCQVSRPSADFVLWKSQIASSLKFTFSNLNSGSDFILLTKIKKIFQRKWTQYNKIYHRRYRFLAYLSCQHVLWKEKFTLKNANWHVWIKCRYFIS